jgi:DNA-binding transcriptional LysR family regulator
VNDPIDSRQLQIFLCLAGKGNLKSAAAELFLTSSAISHSISNLEASLGVSLFYRSGKGLVLTPKAEFLYRKEIP